MRAGNQARGGKPDEHGNNAGMAARLNDERELLREVALPLRGLRYGSVVLQVYEGRIVELNKTERIRKRSA
jgi:hypothetical protein